VKILPEVAEPMGLVESWLDAAAQQRVRPNPGAMTLATVSPQTGRPSARVVLVRGVDKHAGYVVFYTNYASRKATEIGAGGWTAGVLHWDALGRQIRLEGPAVRSPAAESDAYFASRPWRSQINAWASRQSEPLAAAAALETRARAIAARFATPDPFGDIEPDEPPTVPRPEFWGGYRLWVAAVEFWASGRGRFHERLRFERELERSATGDYVGQAWRSRRLQP